MNDRAAGYKSWSLSPTDLRISYASFKTDESWFGPLEPMKPLASPEITGRQWDFPAGYNLNTTARPYEAISFNLLRGLADSYDLLRLVIETRKDQVARLDWSIRKRHKKVFKEDDAERIEQIGAFFRRPDGQHGFADWMRLILEDLFVIDAPALYLQRNRSGQLIALHPIDGATIKPIIDDWGRIPQPYANNDEMIYPPAYQQILKGYPAVDYAANDLIYRPRNIRTHRVYGFSPVEQIVTTVNIALRRQIFLLDYFTEGNIPDSLIGVPENWTPDQIATYQKYWDTYFDGDLGRRRKAKFVPGGVAKTFLQTKEPSLTGPFDEWLARLICFAFSISPQGLVQQINRATAQTQKELAQEEGLLPILGWAKNLVDDILIDEFAAPDLEFVWDFDPKLDPATQESILSGYTAKGILTINEARAVLGHAPLMEASADRPMVLTGAGYVVLPDISKAITRQSATHAEKRTSINPDLVLFGKAAAWDEDKHPRWPSGTPESQGGRFAPADGSGPSQESNIDREKPQHVAADGPYKPEGALSVPIEGTDPLDPQGLNTIPTTEEQKAIADTLNTIDKGSADEIAALAPHGYTNYPHPKTGAVLPPSVGVYRSYTVPSDARGRGNSRVIIDDGSGSIYYTNTHYKSFYHVTTSATKK